MEGKNTLLVSGIGEKLPINAKRHFCPEEGLSDLARMINVDAQWFCIVSARPNVVSFHLDRQRLARMFLPGRRFEVIVEFRSTDVACVR